MKLIVGLGNPGTRYAKTRHNIGFMLVDALAQDTSLDCGVWKMNKKFNAEIAHSADRKTILLKPQTFMNESGRAVRAALQFFKLPSDDLYVIHDDLDVPFGAYKIQQGRGSAGHRGIESIFTYIATRNFTRVRIGIADGEKQKQGADFVLARFTKKEQKELPALFARLTKELLNDIA
ncbi:MAG: aminoacyl-tRNA hydrolase [Candidatus Magasanikbacteria bacterium]|nr:aminoacyl-tRNA hydrolase [Candidatus Magasanikbacteria bacterium]